VQLELHFEAGQGIYAADSLFFRLADVSSTSPDCLQLPISRCWLGRGCATRHSPTATKNAIERDDMGSECGFALDRLVFVGVQLALRKLRNYICAYAESAKPFRWTCTDPKRRIRTHEFTGTAHYWHRDRDAWSLRSLPPSPSARRFDANALAVADQQRGLAA